MFQAYKPVIVRREVDDTHYYFINNTYVPGVTTILHETLPTPDALRRWIGDVGNEKAQQKLEFAADRGSRIHSACERLLQGKEVNLKAEFPQLDDKKCVVSFVDWVNEYKPEIRDMKYIEFVVASRHGFAGTMDLFCYIDNKPWIVDFKTSSGIYDAYKLQLTAYKQAFYEMTGIEANTGILHLNHKTKKGWTFVDKMEIAKRPVVFDDFLKVFDVYKILNGGDVRPPRLKSVYPEVIKLYEDIKTTKEHLKGGEQ